MSKFLLAITAFSVFFITGNARAGQDLVLIQDLPAITHVDVGIEGHTHGDLMAFEAAFSSSQGDGVMSGILITVDIPIGTNGHFFDRVSQIVFDFGGVDTIVIGGKSVYPGGRSEMLHNAEQVRPILGGTGRFIGARGQVSTTRRDQGHYEHHLRLVD